MTGERKSGAQPGDTGSKSAQIKDTASGEVELEVGANLTALLPMKENKDSMPTASIYVDDTSRKNRGSAEDIEIPAGGREVVQIPKDRLKGTVEITRIGKKGENDEYFVLPLGAVRERGGDVIDPAVIAKDGPLYLQDLNKEHQKAKIKKILEMPNGVFSVVTGSSLYEMRATGEDKIVDGKIESIGASNSLGEVYVFLGDKKYVLDSDSKPIKVGQKLEFYSGDYRAQVWQTIETVKEILNNDNGGYIIKVGNDIAFFNSKDTRRRKLVKNIPASFLNQDISVKKVINSDGDVEDYTLPQTVVEEGMEKDVQTIEVGGWLYLKQGTNEPTKRRVVEIEEMPDGGYKVIGGGQSVYRFYPGADAMEFQEVGYKPKIKTVVINKFDKKDI